MFHMHRNIQSSQISVHFKFFGALIAFLLFWAGVAVVPANAAFPWNTANGNWQDPSSWSGGLVPSGSNGTTDIRFHTYSGTWTGTIDNVTADGYMNSLTNIGALYIGNGSSSANGTLIINYTNTTAALQGNGAFDIGYGNGTGIVFLQNGKIDDGANTINVGGNGAGMLKMTGGTVTSATFNVNNNGTLDLQGGLLTTPLLSLVGAGTAKVLQSGGTVNINGKLSLFDSTYYLMGGTANVSMAGQEMVYNNVGGGPGTLVVSGGYFHATSVIQMAGPYYVHTMNAAMKIFGGTSEFSGGLYFGDQGYGAAGVETLYMNGGTLNVTNGTGVLSAIGDPGSYLTVSNGTLNVKDFEVGVPAAIHGGQVTVVKGGVLNVQSTGPVTGSVDVASQGVLEMIGSGMTLNGGGITNRNGGTVRFTGTNNPAITLTGSGAFVTTNATIEIKNADAINLAGNVATKITYQGTNTLSFNNATNVTVASFNLDNASAGVGAKFATLNLTNASVFQAGTLTNSAIGVVTMYDTGKMIVTNVLVNSGIIQGGSGSTPGLTTTALFNQATGVITGITTLAVNGGGLTNAGAIYLAAGSASISGPVTNSGVMNFSGGATVQKSGGDLVNSGNLVFSGGSSGTLSNNYLNNGGLISAAADSPVTVVANALANHGSGMITGRVTLLVSGGLTNNNVIQIENANLTVGGAMTNSGTVRLLNSAGNSFAAVDNTGTFEMSGASGVFAGAVTNTGLVRINNSVNTFNAVVVNNGGWINDPSTNTFLSGYTIGSGGSLSMASGDVFVFSGGNFANSSTQSNTYNTIDGKFVFSGGPGATQAFAVAGLNLAALTPTGTNDVGLNGGTMLDPHSISYFQNNFALGTLEIAANTTVEVWNASSSSLAGLFLSNLVMGANSALIISNAVQVYYISTNAAFGANVVLLQPNQGLAGASGFHELVIPEPSTLLLAAAGLMTLWRVRRKKTED